MTARVVARQYAQALFDVARRSGQVDRVDREMRAFQALVSSHAELSRVLTNPAVPAPQKRAVVQGLVSAADDISVEVQRALLLLAERDRLMLIDDIIAAFAERVLEADRVVRAELTTAVDLDDRSKQQLVGALSKAVGSELTVTERVDPAIIGGIVAKVGSVVFDASITRQVERLREKLLTEAQ
jgi:F-type H+-transporting ATPase subunit delta